jgi:hypothetical protein
MLQALVAGAVFVGATGAAWWAHRKLDARRVERENHMTRLYEVTVLRQLLNAAGTEKNRSYILNFALMRRPSMPAWPEWGEVWGDDKPVIPQ